MAQLSHIMTLANSIIGVSVLAMPFCFKQCGIVLAILVLLLSSVLSRLACHFLVKSAVMSRRRNFELLAFHSFGHMGKFLVELFIIGFLVGTCIAFFVVMGDLGPQIMGKVIDRSPEDIRTSLLVITSVFIVLPLGLLRNIDSLSSVCTATIVFYLCLVLKVITESMQHIFVGDWYDHVYYWRPSGILQCLPIFSMALFCQTQLFEIYDTIPNVSLEKMNEVVRGALNICTLVYLCVGFFGYIAFCTQPFTGNILLSFEPSISSEMIKLGFVFSIAFSFPLVIFPCRASLNSLLFRRVYTHEPSINYLPETRFRCLTIAIVAISLITGILIPNIEFVLGLVGSTIGVMICLIFPAIFFISISSKHTNERLLAQAILFIGICIMTLGTYANLYAMEESTNTKTFATTNNPLSQINNLPLSINKDDNHLIVNVPNNPEILADAKEKVESLPKFDIIDKPPDLKAKDVRQEPPIPVERIVVTQKPIVETQQFSENIVATFAPDINKIVEKIRTMDENKSAKDENAKVVQPANLKTEDKINTIQQKEKAVYMQNNDNLINSDAIKKEESELAADREASNNLVADRHEELKKTLEKYKQEQLQMIKEQKEILKDIKEQQQEIEREKQRMAKDELKKNEEKQKVQQDVVAPKVKAVYIANFNENRLPENLNVERNQKAGEENKNSVKEKLRDKFKTADKEMKVKDTESEKNDKKNVESDPKDANSDTRSPKREINAAPPNDAVNAKEKSALKQTGTKQMIKGPILKALTKHALQKSDSGIDLKETSNYTRIKQENKDMPDNNAANVLEKVVLKAEDKRMQDQYSLPIALKMRNQTKVSNASIQSPNKSDENIQAIRRDILENHEREKRETDEGVKDGNTKVGNGESYRRMDSFMKHATKASKQKNCVKPEADVAEKATTRPNKEKTPNATKTYTTGVSLIKTNIYLSEHKLPNAISVDSSIDMEGEYVKVKQRDLKAVGSNQDGDI